MKTENREIVLTKTVYIADDGTEFGSLQECFDYEFMPKQRALGNVVWIVKHIKNPKYIEVFSSEALALKSLENADLNSFDIAEVVIDHRFKLLEPKK